MSLKYKNTRIIKLNQKEYDLILFVREKMPFGRCVLVTHQGQPVKIEDINPARMLGANEPPQEGREFSQGSSSG